MGGGGAVVPTSGTLWLHRDTVPNEQYAPAFFMQVLQGHHEGQRRDCGRGSQLAHVTAVQEQPEIAKNVAFLTTNTVLRKN